MDHYYGIFPVTWCFACPSSFFDRTIYLLYDFGGQFRRIVDYVYSVVCAFFYFFLYYYY